jgi:ADP-ribose pyrophosphatase YjhB (NUDIX family)
LLALLRGHAPADPHEARMLAELTAFVEAHPACFERSLLIGHVTGSAWIVGPARERTLLLHHGKLDKWLQPGGHCDGSPDVAGVALREAQEETGLKSLRLVSPRVFDVDNHAIPARGAEPAHIHYDVRFLFEADPAEPLAVSEESHDLAWIELAGVSRYTQEESVLRMVRKTR